MSGIVLEMKVHRLERPCNKCQALNLLQPDAYFVTNIFFSKGIRTNGCPKIVFSDTNRDICAAKSALAFSACSGLVTRKVLRHYGGIQNQSQKNTGHPATLSDHYMIRLLMHYLHT